MRETDEIARELFVEEKARMQEKIDIAKKLIGLGLDNVSISQATDLKIEQIEQLC